MSRMHGLIILAVLFLAFNYWLVASMHFTNLGDAIVFMFDMAPLEAIVFAFLLWALFAGGGRW